MSRKHTHSQPGVSAGAVPVRAPKPRVAQPARTTAAPNPAAAAAAPQPSEEAVARLAYSYWEGRGFQGGSPEEDWLRAERELSKAS